MTYDSMMKRPPISALAAMLVSANAPAIAAPRTPPISISGQNALDQAIAKATGGEVFRLTDGNYSLGIAGKRFNPPIIISGTRNARFAAFGKITGSSGLTFKGVGFYGKPGMADGHWLIQIAASEKIIFDDVLISGADQTGYGIFVRTHDIRAITVRNSEITKLKFGALIWGGSDWLIENNAFHDLSSDGIQVGNTIRLTIRHNHFRDFNPHSGFHPDAVQLVSPTTDTLLEANIVRGATQGLFYDGRQGQQKNLRVINNDIAVSYGNAIRFDDAEGFVSGNKVAKAGRYAPIVRLSKMKSDGKNKADGKPF